MTIRLSLALLTLLALRSSTPAATSPEATCARASGGAAVRCLADYTAAVERCRKTADAACEANARAASGLIATALAAPADPVRTACSEDASEALGYLSQADAIARAPESCTDFAEDFLAIGYAPNLAALPPRAMRCQRRVTGVLRRLRGAVIAHFGPGCFEKEVAGKTCRHAARDRAVVRARQSARKAILAGCHADFDALGVSTLTPTTAAVDDLVERVVTRARHFAERSYPANELGPTAVYGPHKIGVRTLALADASRTDVGSTDPRPVTVEVYYPSTDAATAGVPKDVIKVLGLDIVASPAYRDVAVAPGPFPLVLFSHGNGGIRFQSFFFAAHLASHGYVVVCPDHRGNTFVDIAAGVVDPDVARNRPLDLSFLIDQFLAFNGSAGGAFAGAIDPDRIGVSGHSFGGYTAFAIAGGAFSLGTFADPRVKAILPQAPANLFPDAFFDTIHVPTLILGGSIDTTTPFAANQQTPFDLLPSGAAIVGLGELADAGHFTFSDFCEVPRDLLSFLGGFDEACEPRHLAWRWAHRIVNYLALNFFDATLGGDAEAAARLTPAALATVDELTYQAK